VPDSGTRGRRRHARAQRITAAEIKTKGEFPMTNTNKDTTTEYILRMYDKLTPENKKKFREYLDFLLFCQREEEAQG
jgi:hypothetical protein